MNWKEGFECSVTINIYPILEGNNPFRLERSNLECHYSKALVLFQSSAIMDVNYWRMRTRLHKVIKN